jgi:acetate CoA/acetoacetate CoA-transferase alpha subunit
MVAKPIISAEKATDLVQDGDVLMVGGFLGCGSPEALIDALEKSGRKDLTLVCNDTAMHNAKTGQVTFVGKLVAKKMFKKMYVSHIGTNAETQRQMNAGETDVVLVPQGTLAEQVRAGGAGLGGILTPTGVGTEVEAGKMVIELDGRKYLLEKGLKGDVAIIKARKADRAGNLVYGKSERNFNPLMAMACKTVIVEADEIVEIGAIDPEEVITPSVFVHYLVKSGK